MIVVKTIKAKIFALTNTKEEKLSREYQNFQLVLRGEEKAQGVRLYSVTKQQAERARRRILKCGGKQVHDDHPLIIRRDCFRVEKQISTKLAKWWAKVPVYGGSIWVPIRIPYSQEPLLKHCLRETKLVKQGRNWFLRIAVQEERTIEFPTDPSRVAVVGVDLGEANPATSVVLAEGKIIKPMFHATMVRGVRAHYTNLRKQFGRKKVKHGRRVVKKIGNKEQRIVDYHLHVAPGKS